MRKEKQCVDGIIGNRKHSKMEENKPRKKWRVILFTGFGRKLREVVSQ